MYSNVFEFIELFNKFTNFGLKQISVKFEKNIIYLKLIKRIKPIKIIIIHVIMHSINLLN